MMDIILGSVLCIYKSTVASIKNRKNKMDRDIVRGRAIRKILSVGNTKIMCEMFRLIFFFWKCLIGFNFFF